MLFTAGASPLILVDDFCDDNRARSLITLFLLVLPRVLLSRLVMRSGTPSFMSWTRRLSLYRLELLASCISPVMAWRGVIWVVLV